MNAVNPVPSPASGAEPSMEEILASIRRIIADDRPLPGVASRQPHLETRSETAKAEPALAMGTSLLDAMPQGQGVVASPQFPTPEGPASVMDTPHPLAPAAAEPAPPAGSAAPSVAANAVALPQQDAHEAALRDMHEEPDALAAAVTAAHDHVYEGQFSEEAVDAEPVGGAPEHEGPEAPVHRPAAEEPAMPATGETREVPPQDQLGSGLFSAATSQSLAAAFNTLAISRLADDSQELRSLARDMLRPLLKDWLDAHLPGLVESIIREEIDRMARRTR